MKALHLLGFLTPKEMLCMFAHALHTTLCYYRIIGLTVGVGLLIIVAVGIFVVLNKKYPYNEF